MADNIFDQQNILEIDFSRLKQDLVKRARSRMLSQFWKSELLLALLDAVSEEQKELYDVQIQIQEGRTLAKAQGVNLDVLGELVGASKTLFNYNLVSWFAPDMDGREYDVSAVWVTNAPLTQNENAPDEVWRRIILAKIFKNHMNCASLPEIRMFVKTMANLRISLLPIGLKKVRLVVPANTDRSIIRFFCSVLKDTTMDFAYMLPLPPEVELDSEAIWLAIQSDTGEFNSFAPDMEQGKPDLGKATLIVTIGESI